MHNLLSFRVCFQAAEEVDHRITELRVMSNALVNTAFEDAWERSTNEVSMTITQSVTHARAHVCSWVCAYTCICALGVQRGNDPG